MKTAIFDSTQVPHRCAICNKVIENYESMPQIWSPEHDGYICYDCYKKTCENPDLKEFHKEAEK